MSSLRKKYEEFNDNMWLDAKCDEAYYSGKMAGCGEIDNIFDEDLLDPSSLKNYKMANIQQKRAEIPQVAEKTLLIMMALWLPIVNY